MGTGDRNDPYRNFRFLLEIDGITQAGFSEASGLEISTEVVDYREGNELPWVRKLTGLNKYVELTFKWGSTDSVEFYEWYMKSVNGAAERKNGSVVLQDETGEEKLRWNFTNAWPSKWTGPSFNATANEVAIESLTLVHEGLAKA